VSFDPTKVALEVSRKAPKPAKGPGAELLREVTGVRSRPAPDNKNLAKVAEAARRGV
jgi:hypothetical protein